MKIYIANIVSPSVMEKPDGEYIKKMSCSGPRKIWYLEPGDYLITPHSIPHKENPSLHLVNMNEKNILTPSSNDEPGLCRNILLDENLLKILRELAANDAIFIPFIFDEHFFDLQRELSCRVGVFPYGTEINTKNLNNVIDSSHFLNDKSNFKGFLNQMDLPTLPGIVCKAKDLKEHLPHQINIHNKVILKPTRGSNGHLNLTFDKSDQIEKIDEYLAKFKDLNENILVEKFIETFSQPSLEYFVDDSGFYRYYACDMICRNNAWTGMYIPPKETSAEILEKIWNDGDRFAQSIYQKGFRGVFDLDLVLSNHKEYFFTETNARTTGGTHTNFIINKFSKNKFSLADVKVVSSKNAQALVSFLRKEKLLYDLDSQKGVIIVQYGEGLDDKFRYIIIGDSFREIDEVNSSIANFLNTHVWNDNNTDTFISYNHIFNPGREKILEYGKSIFKNHFDSNSFSLLELGAGTGWFSKAILESFPKSRVRLLDRDKKMLDFCRKELAEFKGRMSCDDFLLEDKNWRKQEKVHNVIFSSLCIHHLEGEEKLHFYKDAYNLIAPGGLLLIYDILLPDNELHRKVMAESYDKAVYDLSLKNLNNDSAYSEFVREKWNLFSYPDDPIDKPSEILIHINYLKEIFGNASVYYLDSGHALYGAIK